MARAVGLLPAVVWGVLLGLWRPRGPIFGFEAVAILVVSVAVGVVAGRVSRSRWAMLLAPLLFVTVGETTRIGYDGPTVDHPHASPLGDLALLAGRGFYALLTVLPMVVGAAFGAGSTRSSRSAWRWVGRFFAGVVAVVVVGIGVVVALPGRASLVPGGISELAYAGKLGLMIRGARADAPFLLFVPGAPGGSELGAVRRRLSALEQSFVVVTVDRRGGGRSFGALDPTPTFSVANEMNNVLDVTRYLRERFRRDKIFLVAHSGGTIGAALAVQDQPDLFTAYVGVGQVSNPTASDRTEYDDVLTWARGRGDTRLAEQLTAQGPPPYGSIYAYEPIFSHETDLYGSDASGALLDNLDAPEDSVLDKVHVAAGFLDAFDAYYPKVRDVDFRTQIPRVAVPVYFVDGDREVPSRLRNLKLWFDALQAPRKQMVTLRDAGHRSMFQQPAAFVDVMRRVLAETR